MQTQDAMVSRRHARIFWDGNYWIEDLGSSNGVYVGNDKVQKAPFRPGDTVTCGSLMLRLMPDTSPRMTGNMAPMSTGPMPAVRAVDAAGRLGIMPAVAPPPAVLPPMASPAARAPPPPAPPPMAAVAGAAAVGRHDDAAARARRSAGRAERRPARRHRFAARDDRRTIEPRRGIAHRAQKRNDAERALEEATREAALLKRKLDQLQADSSARAAASQRLTRARDDGELKLLRGRVAELEGQLRRARPADAAVQMPRRAAAAPSIRPLPMPPSRSVIRSPSCAPRCAPPTTKPVS